MLHLFPAEQVLHGQHGHAVRDQHAGSPLGGAPYLLGGRIRGDELRVVCLQLFQLPHQGIVLLIGDCGVILIII